MIKVFCDMDGCLTDFDSAVKALGGDAGLSEKASEEAKLDMYKKIDRAGTDFWSRMNWLKDGVHLWEQLEPYRPVLLSSPGEFMYAPAGKQEWVNKHVPGTTLYLDCDKWGFAERDAILIDDNQDNVGAWIDQGGIGILHTDTASTMNKLHKALEKNKLFIVTALRRTASVLLSYR